MEDKQVNVLIPAYNRPAALSVTLTSLYYQSFKNLNVIVSDQSVPKPIQEFEEVDAVCRTLALKGIKVSFYRNLPNKGMAQQREFLLQRASAPYVLYLDDDLILESYVISNLLNAIQSEECGLAGTGTIGLSYINDERKHEQNIEFWESKVKPETVHPKNENWQRYKLHSAANLFHVEKQLGLKPETPKKYKLAWASACVLYDRKKLLKCGGFDFEVDLPKEHCGEDVAAQMRVLSTYGGCGVIPSGVYHQELRTTIPTRRFNIPEQIDVLKVLDGHHLAGK